MRVKRQFLLHLILIISLIISTTTLMNSVATDLASLYVDPPRFFDKTKTVGTTIAININIKYVVDLYAFEFKLNYSTSVLTATSVTAGSFLLPNIIEYKNVINDTAGYVWYAINQTAGESGVSGSGTLAKITFTVDSIGRSKFKLFDFYFFDSYGKRIWILDQNIFPGYFSNEPVVLYVDPASITDKAIDSTFNINVNIQNVTNFFGFDFKLWYKTSILTATTVTHPTNGFLQPGIFTVHKVINDTAGFVWFAVSQSLAEAGKGVNGSGILATITFKVDALGATQLYLVDSLLTDPAGQMMAHDIYDGHFVNSPVHDIAITSVTPYAPTVMLGQAVNVTVVARNHGDFTESFAVTAYTNTTAIGSSQTVTNLAAGGRTTLTFTWNTAGVTLGKYFISAVATTVSGETDTTDNTCNKAYDYTKKIFFDVTITVIDYPEAVFNYSPMKPGVNQTVTFDASDSDPSGGEITYYWWNFGDGVTAGPTVLPATTHQYTSHGIYNVTLRVDDSEGLTDKTLKHITIYLPDVVALTDVTVSQTTVTKPNSVSINVTVANVCKYSSTFNVTVYYGGTPIDTRTVTNLAAETSTTLTFVWNTTYVRATTAGTTYKISANTSEVLFDGNMNNNVFIDGDVTVNKGPGPTADFTFSPLQPNKSQPVNFDASLSAPDPNTNKPIISYVWDFGDGASGSGKTATHTYANGGSYKVRLNVTDNDNLWDAVESTVIVYVPVVIIPPNASFTYLPASPVVGDTVTFDASTSTQGSGTITGYKWDFGDGATGTSVTTANIYAATGTYTVTLNVTDTEGSFDISSQLITVGKKASTITIVASPSKIKLGESTTISGSITPTKASADVTILYRKTETQTWNTLATVATSSASQYSYAWAPTEYGTFELNATWLGDINTLQASNKTTLVVKEIVASFSYAPSAPIVGDTVTFTSNSTSTGSIQSWQWDFGDDTSGEGATVTHTYTTKGDYTVKLTVTDNDGLTDTFTQSITVSEATTPGGIPLWQIAAIVAVVIIASGLVVYFLIKKKP